MRALSSAFAACGLAISCACGGGSGGGGPPAPPPPPPPPNPFNFTPATPPNEPVGPNFPARAARALFNADVNPDVVAVAPSTGRVVVVTGDGAGNLTFLAGFPAGTDPRGLAAGDLNADGFADVVVTNFGVDTISVLMNNGLGTALSAPTAFAAIDGPISVVMGTFDAGPTVDLIVGSSNTGNPSAAFYAGNGAGGFAAGVSIPTAGGTLDLAAGDVDGDGFLDVVLQGGGFVEILRNDGTGTATFTSTVVVNASVGQGRIALAQVSGSAALDILSTRTALGELYVYTNDGLGAFASFSTTSVGTGPLGMAVADLDGDTFPDVMVAATGDGTVRVLPGNGDGTFDAAHVESVGTSPDTPVHGAFVTPGSGVAVSLTADSAIYLMTKNP